MPVDHKSVKRYWQLDWILTLLGATGIKAVGKSVGEIEPMSLIGTLWERFGTSKKEWILKKTLPWESKIVLQPLLAFLHPHKSLCM